MTTTITNFYLLDTRNREIAREMGFNGVILLRNDLFFIVQARGEWAIEAGWPDKSNHKTTVGWFRTEADAQAALAWLMMVSPPNG